MRSKGGGRTVDACTAWEKWKNGIRWDLLTGKQTGASGRNNGRTRREMLYNGNDDGGKASCKIAIYAKCDQETIVSLEGSAPPRPSLSASTLDTRMGRSTVRPFIGLTNTHAGTSPISSWVPSAASAPDAVEFLPRKARIAELIDDRRGRELSFMTRHQPSSKDSKIVKYSPSRVRGSSSGRTGSKSWRTGRECEEADPVLPTLKEDVRDCMKEG